MFILVRKWLCILLIIISSVILTTLTFVGGTYTCIKLKSQSSKSLTVFGHRNDTILLKNNIDAYWFSTVTVTQCLAPGDASHDFYVYVIKSDNTAHNNVKELVSEPRYYQYSPSYNSGIQDYIYLLPGSDFTYRFCLASTTNQDQKATYFLFNDITNYWNYVKDYQNGVKYSILSIPLVASRNNQTTCFDIAYKVTHASYYFMMVLSPANISYSYNFTLNKVFYDTSSVTQYCKVSNLNTCEIVLSSEDFKHENYDILAYVQPGFAERSIITHLCLTAFVGSVTLKKISYISYTLFGLAVLLLVVTVVLCICPILLHKRKAHKRMQELRTLLQNDCVN